MRTPEARGPRVATIPLHADFAGTLARRLLAVTPDPLALARTLLLLPNRRAARALTAAFVAASGGRGLLLPRMIAVSDLEDADAALGDGLDDAIPPAIAGTERRFRLAGILVNAGQRPAAALHDAAGLARALDTLHVEGRTAADLAVIDTSGLAHHWAKTVARLEVLLRAWPELLDARGLIDPARRRVLLAQAAAARWAQDGSETPVIAAGIANAPPFVAALLRAVARLERGQVVLPGLDLAMGEEAWGAIDPSDASLAAHPQAALKLLLDRIGVARAEVDCWDDSPAPHGARVAAAARALDPAAFTPAWEAGGGAALADVALIEAANPTEEAQAIALAMRGALEVPGRTSALVTPDRGLAARVRAHLARWGVDVDDSAGEPLGQTPPGVFLRLLADAAAGGFGVVPVLALLKHPFAGAADRLAHLDAVRALDLELREPPPPAPGLASVGRRVRVDDGAWWAGITAALAPLGGERPLPEHIAALTAAATALGGDRPWTGPDGRALSEAIDLLGEQGLHLPPMAMDEAAAILAAMLGEVPVRAVWGGHPRLAILGLLEARLQRADLTILGGLNEGVWPAAPAPDPWLPPLARGQLGLPPLEARIGLAAHDFLAALGGPEVLLTRARRDATAPTSPSRFLLRLQALHPLRAADDLLAWARGLDAAEGPPRPATRPQPAPRADLRPRAIRVTQVDTLNADPFAYYASALLRLRRLDAPAADLSAAARGTFLHRVLERWAHAHPDEPGRLPAFADAMFVREYRDAPRLLALWRPRLVRAAGWAAELLAERQAAGWRVLAAEVKGEMALPGGVTLTGKFDRIDVGEGGALAIVDYKSGQPPSNPQLRGGYATQLGLLATMAEAGVFEGVNAGTVTELAYWRLGGGAREPGKPKNAFIPKDKDRPWAQDGDAGMIAFCWAQLDRAIDTYLLADAPFMAKLHPEFATGKDFDQLARVDEWQGR